MDPQQRGNRRREPDSSKSVFTQSKCLEKEDVGCSSPGDKLLN